MVNYSISATSLLAITSSIATVNAAIQQPNNLRQSKQQDTSTTQEHQQRKLITLRYGDTEEDEYHGPSTGGSYLPSGYDYEPAAPHSNHDKIDFVKPVADAGHDQWTSDGWEKKHSSSSSSWSSDGWGKKEHHDGGWKCNSNLLKRWSWDSHKSLHSVDEWSSSSSWSTGKSGKSNSHGGKSGKSGSHSGKSGKSGWSSSSSDGE